VQGVIYIGHTLNISCITLERAYNYAMSMTAVTVIKLRIKIFGY